MTTNGTSELGADSATYTLAMSRQGYDATGATTTYNENRIITKRVRQAYPNHASATTDTVAFDDYVYSTDAIAGVTNNSTEISPKPVACWGLIDRKIVGNSLDVEVVAFHRDGRTGKPVACVILRATDGTNTVTTTVAAMTVSPESTLGPPVLVYRGTLDLTTLNDNADITVNAKVYPWIGAAASVLDSADNAYEARTFSPRTYRKNTSRAANPPIVYVATGGNDTTGAVDTNDATAAASPCLTVTGAINRARTVLGTTAGSLDGLRVRLTEGTWSRAAAPTANTVNAEIVIEPGTGASKALTIFEFGAANNNFNLAYARHRGLTVRRQGAFYAHGSATGHCTFEDCALDFNGNTGALASVATSFHFVNTAMTGHGSTVIGAGTPIIAMLRGSTWGTANSASQVEMYRTLGNSFLGCRAAYGARTNDGAVIAFNKAMSVGSASGAIINVGSDNIVNGVAVVQNVVEYTSTSSQASLLPSADSATTNIRNLITWNNTFAGFDTYGRGNILYNETSGTARTHKLASFKGNIHVQVNTKHDVFQLDGTRTGGWPFMFGVGCVGEVARYASAGGKQLGSDFAMFYPGLSASFGTGNTGAGNDPLFTDYKGTTTAGAAGAGGGDYTIGALSPAKARLPTRLLPFDLAGNARPATADASGAYA